MLLFVPSAPAGPAVVEWLCSSLCGLCQRAEEASEDAERAGRLLAGKALTGRWRSGAWGNAQPAAGAVRVKSLEV